MDRGRPANPLEYAPTRELYLGSAIRQMRQGKKLGLRKLAELIPYHPGALSKVENNQALLSIEALQKIAEILEVNADELKQMPVHPRLSKQTAGLGKPTTVEQRGVFEELKEDVQQVKAEFAEVKAILNDLVCSLRKIIPSLVSEPDPWGGRVQSSQYQTHGDDPGDQETNKSVAAGSGQEPTDSKHPESNPVKGFVEEVIEAVNDLPYLDELHSGSVMLTYLVEQDAFGGDRELEEQWFAMLEEAIDKGWDILHFIWLNEDVNRTSHLKRNLRSLPGRRGNYKVYVTTETAPLRHGVDFVAVDSRYDSLKRAFVYNALEPKIGEGPHNIAEIRAIYPMDNKHIRQINNILNRLERWKEGKEGGFKLTSEEERDKLVE